jgi:hypothetical protein
MRVMRILSTKNNFSILFIAFLQVVNIYMSSQRLPNKEDIQRAGNVEETLDYDSVQRLRQGVQSTNILSASEREENVEDVGASSNEANEEISSSSSTDQEAEEAVADDSKQADQEQIMEPDTAPQQQVPTMSPEQVLLLQVLRRAKRQQDLIIEVQKNLKSLANIQKDIERTKEQVKQLLSAFKDSQKQIIQVQRQIVAVERTQEKGFEKLQMQKRAGAIISVKGKVAKNRRKAKKPK